MFGQCLAIGRTDACDAKRASARLGATSGGGRQKKRLADMRMVRDYRCSKAT